MKITKYPQSNLLIEAGGKKILIDPGNLTFEKYSVEDFGNIQAILITHTHPDHLDLASVEKIIESSVPLYANKDVVSKFRSGDSEITKVEPGQEFEVAGFQINPIDIPHCKLLYCTAEKKTLKAPDITRDKRCKAHPDLSPETTDGPPNTGFVINGTFFHPGDGIEIGELTMDNAAIPINGPTIDFKRAWNLINSLGAKKVIPMHYSHPTFIADPKEFAEKGSEGVEVVALKDGESTEV